MLPAARATTDSSPRGNETRWSAQEGIKRPAAGQDRPSVHGLPENKQGRIAPKIGILAIILTIIFISSDYSVVLLLWRCFSTLESHFWPSAALGIQL